jgi:hypothetical protein
MSVQSQESQIFSESDILVIEQMYDRYIQAFITKDYTSIREFLQARFICFRLRGAANS